MSSYFVFFIIFSFCGILYELVWLRLAMAQFEVTTAQVSIVLSVFHGRTPPGFPRIRAAGSALWTKDPLPALAVIAGDGTVDRLFGFARSVGIAPQASFFLVLPVREVSSVAYLLISGVLVGLTMVPRGAHGRSHSAGHVCHPVASRLESSRSFSFPYVSNLPGAVAGAVLPLAIFELRGFIAL